MEDATTKETPESKRTLKKTALYCAIVVLVSTAIVSTLFHNHLDDGLGGADNAEWRDEAQDRDTFAKIVDFRFYSGRHGPSAYYNPVQMLVWRTLITNWDYNTTPEPYHIYCHIIHVLNILLLFLIALALLDKPFFAGCAAMSFALFFPNYQTISWVAGTVTTGTACVFLLLSLLCFIHSFRTRRVLFVVLSCLFYLLGLFTKEFVVFAIPILTLYYIVFHRKRTFKPVKSDLILLPHCITTIPMAIIVFLRLGQSAIVNQWGGFNFSHHMLFRFFDYLSYLVTAHPVHRIANGIIIGCVILCLPSIVKLAKKDKVTLFLCLWFCTALFVYVYSNFRNVYELQRYLYMPSVPWFILMFRLSTQILSKKPILLILPLLGYTLIYNTYLIIESQMQ